MGTTNGGIKVDMGASWIHGIGPGAGDLKEFKRIENPIYSIAKANSIKTVACWQDEEETISRIYWWKSPQSLIDERKIHKMGDKIYDYAIKKAKKATVFESLEHSLNDFNYGTTAED